MAQITNYTTLSTALQDWAEYTLDVDELIGLAEAEFRLYLGPAFARETSTTLSVTDGSAALPSGFIRALALTHETYGEIGQRDIASVRNRRIADSSGIPGIYAITGSTLETAPRYTGALTFDYEGSLSGLSGSNPTNWLILTAPQAYLAMCLHFAKAKDQDPSAPSYKSSALDTLNALGIQSMVAQASRASVTLPGATP